jgi:hypothetical protein
MNPTLLRDLVLDATADDFESFAQIREYVNDENQLVNDGLILSALEDLTKSGEVKCFVYSHEFRRFLPETFGRDKVEDLWFSST